MTALRSAFLLMFLLVAACVPTSQKPARVAVDLTGDWVLTTVSQMGSQDADMALHQTGTQLAGKLSGPQGVSDVTGVIEGGTVRFSFAFDAGGQPVKIEYAGAVTGDTMSGKTIFGPLGEGTFTAKRKRP